MFFEILAMIALAFGAALGIGSLVSPAWAADVVRLVEDPDKPGGYSEFRATYGGFLFLLHATALLLMWISGPTIGAFVAAPIAAGWFGAAIGRTISLLADMDKLRAPALNPVWIATELALGLAIIAPLLQVI